MFGDFSAMIVLAPVLVAQNARNENIINRLLSHYPSHMKYNAAWRGSKKDVPGSAFWCPGRSYFCIPPSSSSMLKFLSLGLGV